MLLAGLAAVLLFPIYLLWGNFTLTNIQADNLFLIHRIAGLYAFSLIFLQTVIGSTRVPLSQYFPPAKVLSFHMGSGKIAFLLALLHPALLYATYLFTSDFSYIDPFLAGEGAFYFNLGITAVLILILTVVAALMRAKIGPRWVTLHRLNYLVFWLIFFHSRNLGVDTHTQTAEIVFTIYAVIVAGVSLRKGFLFIRQTAATKA